MPTKKYAYKIFNLLKQHYPHAKMILQWGNNFELLVAIILSAQCTDKKVNEVTAKLFPKYQQKRRELESRYKEFSRMHIKNEELVEIINFGYVNLAELEQDIKSTGFYHNKAKSVRNASRYILDNYQGALPRTIAELIKIPGVGRKTANVFLGNAYHISEGIAVDTHVKRQAKLLCLTKNTDPDKIEQDLMKLYEKKDWLALTYLLIEHGRNIRRKRSDRKACGKSDCILCSK